MMRDDRIRKLLYVHIREIKKKFGEREYEKANIGWVQSENAISSKIYVSPRQIVCSYYDEDGKIRTECREMYIWSSSTYALWNSGT